MTVAIIDHGSGNLRSASKAFEHVGGDAVIVTSSAERVSSADRIVLPGVGAFGDCHQGLHALDGMVEALEEAVIGRGVPILGICVGMQLMASRGLEGGVHNGLGWITGDVAAISPLDATLKVPHMGWNNLHIQGSHPLFDGLSKEPHMYFVHGFHLAAANDNDVLAIADYGGPVTAAVGRDNIVGTQFHPEKSQALGLRLIENFLNWNP